MARRQRDSAVAPADEKRIAADKQRVGALRPRLAKAASISSLVLALQD